MKINKKQTLVIIVWLAMVFFMKLPLGSLLSTVITTTAVGVLSISAIILIEKYC